MTEEKTKPPIDPDEYEAWAETKRRHDQHDQLWKHYGWLPQIIANKTALIAVGVVALFIGGQDLIANIVAIAQGVIPK